MARLLAPNERLVLIGSTAMRAPDGTPYPSVPMYIIVDESQVNEKTGLSHGEEELIEDISGLLAKKFKQYYDAAQALERQQRREYPVGAKA